MTQEEKELLLKDLCARLPYGVKMSVNDRVEVLQGINIVDNIVEYSSFLASEIEHCKPYLFPLSSMTEEQKEELKQKHIKDEELYVECLTKAAKGDRSMKGKVIIHYAMDWCNANHFDYRGLIEKGLAIDATGLNIY